MNRLALSICVLGIALAVSTPVLLYAKQDAPSQAAEPAPQASNPEAVSVAVWTPPARRAPGISFAAPIEIEPVAQEPAQAVYADALPAAYDGDYDDPFWAIVTRGARLHSDADVSSPITWMYPAGTKLHVIGYRQGWYQVADPETSRRGFIYARYYLEALRAPDAAPVIAKTTVTTETALAEPAEAPKPVRHASRANPYLLAPAETATRTGPIARSARPTFVAARPGSVTSLLNEALRR